MFDKILIANRGEIAVRVIRACKEMGISTVAVYSEADKTALHTQLADQAVCIGPARASESYLNMYHVLSAAYMTKAQAIHPGFGFLSENASFASLCEECGMTFIGPDSKTIELMGNKSNARSLMKASKVPVIPGSEGTVNSVDEAKEIAESLGYPVMVKASSGGGGKGMRVVKSSEELEAAYLAAKSEALASFNDDSIYLEKIIENARHIEVQVLADNYGNCLHLGERDCSIQRRNQKVLEEAPSSAVTSEIRRKLGEVAVRAAKAANYKNAGTIEFLYDKNGNFYFMEMNTRIQVEHPVTEAVTGIDLVKQQIKIAAGQKLELTQDDIKFSGHAIECRINAENPRAGFAPSPGEINYLFIPGGFGLRVDSGIYGGYVVPPYYDSMLAKVIVHAESRAEAVQKMKRALSELVIDGIETNIDFQMDILNNGEFNKGNIDTGFIAKNFNI